MARSKHELIGERLATIDRRRAEIEVELAELPEQLEEARVASLRASPTQATDGVGTPVRSLLEKQGKLERALAALVADRAAAVRVEQEEQAKRLEAVMLEIVGRGDKLRELERDGWREAGTAFAALVELFYARIVPPALHLESLRDDARRAGLDPDTIPQLQAPIRPFPTSPAGFVELLWRTCADPGGRGVRLVGEQHAIRSDAEWALPDLIPDVRPVERVSLRGVEAFEGALPR